MHKVALTLIVALGAVALAGLASLVPQAAVAEEFSKEVGKPLMDAKAAMAKKQWDVALANIKKAQSQPVKKPHEEYVINEMLAAVLQKQGDYAGVARAFEANLSSGRTPPDQVPQRLKIIAQSYATAGNYGKAVEFGNRYVKANGGDPDGHWLVAQAQYRTKDCKNAIRTTQGAIDAARRAGQSPKEDWLKLKLTCQHSLQDDAGMAETREQLVRHFPANKQYWEDLLVTATNNPDNDDRATLNLYRLMLELDVLKKAGDYVELAELAIDNGSPGEAVTVMEKGFANKMLETKDKDRHVRLLNNAKTQAQSVQNSLAELEEEARADSKGASELKLASAYMGAGQYNKAVEAIQRGLTKGGLKRDEAQMMLGRAYFKLKQKDQARKAFGAVPDDSKLARVAQLWGVYTQQS